MALVPFLLGAGAELQRRNEESDRITGKIIDTITPYVMEKVYSNEKLSEKQTKLLEAYNTRYGNNFGMVVNKAGLLESGDEVSADRAIKNYFGVDNLLDVKKITDGMNAEEFQKKFAYNPITARQKSVKDRKEFVGDLFADRSNLKNLMLDPNRETKGIKGFLFGRQLTQEDIPGAIQRVTEATKFKPEGAPTTQTDIASFLGLDTISKALPGMKIGDAISVLNSARASYKQNQIYKNQYDTPELNKEFREFKKTEAGKNYKGTATDYAFDYYYLPQEIQKIKRIQGITETSPATAKTTVKSDTPLKGNELVVSQAKEAINKVRASNAPDADERIESIKQDLRQILGVTNLSEYNL